MRKPILNFNLLLVFCLFIPIMGYGQISKKLDLSLKEKTLREFFQMIESQTEFTFMYNNIDLNQTVSIDVIETPLDNILKAVLTPKSLIYEVRNRQILIKDALPTQPTNQPARTIIGIVTGTVTDERGDPIIGANIVEKGTTNGVITDMDGKFSLSVADNAALEITYIGYITQSMSIGNQSTLQIVLKEDLQALDEVVVVGYGSVKKRDLTGSVTRVSADKYQNQAKMQVTDMLAGTVAGFYAQQGTDAAGGVSSLQVRGPTSLKASTQPLIVLDGVIYNGTIADINPNDVESIDILKDASSSAVYGSRAAAGVMIITTKKGHKGKPTVDFSTQIGIVDRTNKSFKSYDAKDFPTYRKDAMTVWFPNAYPYYYYDPGNLPAETTLEEWRNASANPAADNKAEWGARLNLFPIEFDNFMSGKTIDLEDLSFQTGLRQSYDVSVRGGTDNINYYWSAGYDDNTSVQVGSKFKTVRTRFNSDYKITNWLTVGINAQYADRDEGGKPVGYSSMVSPFANIYDEQKKLVWYPTGYIGMGNPFTNYEEQDKYRRVNSLFASLFVNVSLPFGFKYEINFQPRYENLKDFNFWGSDTFTGSISYSKGYGSRLESSSYEWMLDNIIRWNKQFGVHRFDLTLLYNAEQGRAWSSTMTGETFAPNSNLGYHALQQAEKLSITNSDTELTANAAMARINYTLMDKYLLTASVRQDGYSGFGKQNRKAVFPAAAVAWRISEESFFNVPQIDNLKLRVSWGVNGNRSIGQYSSLAGIQSELYFDGTNVTSNVYNSSLANPNLKWERTESLNFGIDLSLFNNRILLIADYYNMTTTDLLMDRRLPELTGFTSVVTNLGKLGNKGLDITLSTLNIKNHNLTWQSNFVFSLNRNEIKELFGDYGDYVLLGKEYYGELPDYNNRLFPGQSIDRIWAYKVTGVWQTEEKEQAAVYNLEPGDFKSEDMDGNDKYEDKMDKQFIGYTRPQFRLGLSNDFSFLKHFTASIFLRADLGHMARASLAERAGGYLYNRINEFDFPYWTPENRNNEWCGLRSNPNSYGGGLEIYKPASFLRIQDVSLAYNVPDKIINKVKLSNLRLYFAIRNLYCFTDWMGWDPESLNSPMPRTYTFGLNVSF
ncbi:MAG: TonB-dependent receptor [Tannerellaceae bacterium]|nr:TonB-dependent receptor [Tannerellaceae bacterium]